MQTFKLNIVTPEGMEFNGECVEVIIPGSEGMFGVLAKHMNFISSTKAGRVIVKFENGSEAVYVVSSGIAEVKAGECSVLAENCIKLSDIDVNKTKAKLQELQLALETAETETQSKMIVEQIEYFKAQLG